MSCFIGNEWKDGEGMKESAGYVWRVFLLTLRQILRRPQFIVIVFFPMLIVTLFQALPPQEVTAPVNVGVALRDGTGKEFQELIESYSGAVVSFCPTDIETLENNVALSRWDCGLIVEDDFENRLQELNTDNLITLVVSEGSVVYPLVREAASACIAQIITPYIAENYLIDEGMDSIEELPFAERVDIQLEVLDGGLLRVAQVVETIWSKLLLGALTTAAAVYVLMIAADLGRWLDGTAGRMECRLRGIALCTAPRLLALLCPAVLGVVFATITTHTQGVLMESLGLLAILGTLGLLLCRRPGLWKPLPLIIPLSCPAALLYALMPTRLPWWSLFLGTAIFIILIVLIDCHSLHNSR